MSYTEGHLPLCLAPFPVVIELIVLSLMSSVMSLNDCRNVHRASFWVDTIFDGVILPATNRNCSICSDTGNDTLVVVGIANIASDTLGLGVLGQGRGSIEVPKTFGALELFVAVGRGLQVSNEG